MKNNTIIRSLSKSKFIKRHLVLTILSILIYVSLLNDMPVLIYMLLSIFAPWVSFVYEGVIIIGRLHDLNKPAILAAFIYLKCRIFIGLLTDQFTYREGIFLGAYLLFIVTLYIKEPNDKKKIETNTPQ